MAGKRRSIHLAPLAYVAYKAGSGFPRGTRRDGIRLYSAPSTYNLEEAFELVKGKRQEVQPIPQSVVSVASSKFGTCTQFGPVLISGGCMYCGIYD